TEDIYEAQEKYYSAKTALDNEWYSAEIAALEDIPRSIEDLKTAMELALGEYQASFLELFGGDACKVKELDNMITGKMGFKKTFSVTGQTYPRKQDYRILTAVAGIAQSAHKFTNDIRLLQSFGEICEPFGGKQVGSSAMAYKQNPMRSERMASLARYIMTDALNPVLTAANQWFERTLDDSANKRISVPEAFLAADAVLMLYQNISRGLVVYPKVIEAHLQAELPFMATENILMEAVRRGGDRQELHEKIRRHSVAASREVKENGRPNDLLQRIAADPAFNLSQDQLSQLLDSSLYIGRAPEQVAEFLNQSVDPLLAAEPPLPEESLKV
ncbi:MAG: adenylosuccinate lyase, partial [Clostridia bacterium]|nr:adenylosuccinate lyase [Clostridia bacterium]